MWHFSKREKIKNIAQQFKNKRINETISVEAKASSKPGVYKVTFVFWVTQL